MIPLVEPVARTPAQRTARAAALRRLLDPVEAWTVEERADLAERLAIMAEARVDGAERAAEACVRAARLRAVP